MESEFKKEAYNNASRDSRCSHLGLPGRPPMRLPSGQEFVILTL